MLIILGRFYELRIEFYQALDYLQCKKENPRHLVLGYLLVRLKLINKHHTSRLVT